MSERMEWNGRKYRRYPDSERRSDRLYWHRSKQGGGIAYLHRDVWEHHNGPIPDGYHVHHVDGNTLNNDIENLECVTPKQHIGERHKWDDERKREQAKHLDRIRDSTKAWHRSEEGREVHRRVGSLAYESFKPTPKPCDHCATVFAPRAIGNRDRFCSNACKSAWRRAKGVDNETRTCAECGSSFAANKHSKARACSRSCGNRARGRALAARLRSDG